MEKYLQNKKIAISISDSEDIFQLGFSEIHVKDSMIEFARHLLLQGATMLYGGDLRMGGFTEIFSDISSEYKSTRKSENPSFINYFFWPMQLKIGLDEKIKFQKKRVGVVKVPIEESLKVDKNIFLSPDTIENKYIWSKCLTKMRYEMNEALDARVVIGGRNTGYKGKMAGIVEETLIALITKKPTFIIGAFGGASLKMIEAITHDIDVINVKGSFYHSEEFVAFKEYYNQNSMTDTLDLLEVNDFFKNLTINDLNNGLTPEENSRLFVTPHIPEIIYLVLKGLKNCF
jgi:hypothetical protein